MQKNAKNDLVKYQQGDDSTMTRTTPHADEGKTIWQPAEPALWGNLIGGEGGVLFFREKKMCNFFSRVPRVGVCLLVRKCVRVYACALRRCDLNLG